VGAKRVPLDDVLPSSARHSHFRTPLKNGGAGRMPAPFWRGVLMSRQWRRARERSAVWVIPCPYAVMRLRRASCCLASSTGSGRSSDRPSAAPARRRIPWGRGGWCYGDRLKSADGRVRSPRAPPMSFTAAEIRPSGGISTSRTRPAILPLLFRAPLPKRERVRALPRAMRRDDACQTPRRSAVSILRRISDRDAFPRSRHLPLSNAWAVRAGRGRDVTTERAT
jgi:hypothetical protein